MESILRFNLNKDLIGIRMDDYKVDETYESADECSTCGVKYQILITCKQDGFMVIRSKCPVCEYAEVEGTGWTIDENGHITNRGNVGPCLGCGHLVIDVPIILFPKESNIELDFCGDCARRLGIFEMFKEELESEE